MTSSLGHDEPASPPEVSVESDRARMARAVHDLEAAKLRVEREGQRITAETQSRLVVELLPVLDGLDRTIHAARDARTAPLVQGIRMVRAQLESVLAGYGVARMNATHTVFDPSIHEAVSVHPVRNAAQHGIVVDEVEPGYLFGNRLLRPAKVVVGRLSDGRST